MAARDLHSNVKAVVALETTAITVGGVTTGEVIDTAGFESLEFVLQSGELTSGTIAPMIEDGAEADLSDAAEVPASQLAGTVAGATFAQGDDHAAKRIGYRGHRRYVRLSADAANPTAASGTATLGEGLAAGEKLTIESVDFVGKAKFASNIVTCAGVQAGDKVTANGVEFTAIANGGTPAAGEFEVGAGGTADADTAAALAAAIAASEDADVVGVLTAANVAGQATVTVTALGAGAAGNAITLTTSEGTRLAVTTAGGKLAGAYDAAADEWPVEATLEASAAALAAAIAGSETEGIAGVVTATAAGAVVTVAAVAGGTAGDALTFTKTGDHITLDPATGTLAGGVDAVGTIGAVAILGHPRVAPVE